MNVAVERSADCKIPRGYISLHASVWTHRHAVAGKLNAAVQLSIYVNILVAGKLSLNADRLSDVGESFRWCAHPMPPCRQNHTDCKPSRRAMPRVASSIAEPTVTGPVPQRSLRTTWRLYYP